MSVMVNWSDDQDNNGSWTTHEDGRHEVKVERNFLGIPVEGVYNHSHTLPAQRPLEDIRPALQAVLDDPNIVTFGWTQYTPYFNDGDECVFNVHSIWFKTPDDGPDERPNEWSYTLDDHPTFRMGYDSTSHSWALEPGLERYQETYERISKLNELIQSGWFDVALKTAFGDHAIITIHRDKIEVETYSHD